MGILHVSPVNDLIQHVVDDDEDCPCGPRAEVVFRADGSCGWIIVHHALDGRETGEAIGGV
jgi:hypothetical protein